MGTKAISGKSYGSIPHLPGSKYGNRDDKGCSPEMSLLFTTKKKHNYDTITVTEKLDGSNVGITNINGKYVPINHAGYPAISSPRVQHRLFAIWVYQHITTIKETIPNNGDRICGEWLAQAHGTRYDLTQYRSPFVAFDIIRNNKRIPYTEFRTICTNTGIPPTPLLWKGPEPCPIETALSLLGNHGQYGALDLAEGCVWRLERNGEYLAMAKYVRPEKEIGQYLPEKSGKPPVWNLKDIIG